MNPFLVGALVGTLYYVTRRRQPPRRNPAPKTREPLSDSDRRVLRAAQRLSQEFHGNTDHIRELRPSERILPRFVVDAGKLEEFTYEPGHGQHDDAEYSHEAGDQGILAPKAKHKPVLAVDPRTRKPVLVMDRSSMRLTDRGFLG